MSTNSDPFSLTSGSGGAGDMEDEKQKAQDLSDSDAAVDEEDVQVGTAGNIRATTENVQTGLEGQDQMGDPSLQDVTLGPGSTATVDNTGGVNSETKGRMTLTNQQDGGLSLSVDRPGNQAATTVKAGNAASGEGTRVDQLDAVQQADAAASGGGGGGSGPGQAAQQAGQTRPSQPSSSGIFGGGGGLGFPGGGSGGLSSLLSNPVVIVLVVVAAALAFFASDDSSSNSSGGSGGGS
jgi:hypothetical protein